VGWGVGDWEVRVDKTYGGASIFVIGEVWVFSLLNFGIRGRRRLSYNQSKRANTNCASSSVAVA
jgi:hypothetical protein